MAMRSHEIFFQRFLYVLLILSMSFFPGTMSADPRQPENPTDPRVNLNETKDIEKNQDYQVILVNTNGGKVSGILVLPVDYIEFRVTEKRGAEKKKIFLSTIERIEFLKWKGIEVGANEFVFYPNQIKFTLTDKNTVECGSNIKILNKLTVIDGKKKHVAHAYFYDYWENDAWRSSGQSDKLYPETNPNPGTVVRITFNR